MIRQLALAALYLALAVGVWWMVKAGVESMLEAWAPDPGVEGNSSGLRSRPGRTAVLPTGRPAGTFQRRSGLSQPAPVGEVVREGRQPGQLLRRVP
jgi:hypothetical protein